MLVSSPPPGVGIYMVIGGGASRLREMRVGPHLDRGLQPIGKTLHLDRGVTQWGMCECGLGVFQTVGGVILRVEFV